MRFRSVSDSKQDTGRGDRRPGKRLLACSLALTLLFSLVPRMPVRAESMDSVTMTEEEFRQKYGGLQQTAETRAEEEAETDADSAAIGTNGLMLFSAAAETEADDSDLGTQLTGFAAAVYELLEQTELTTDTNSAEITYSYADGEEAAGSQELTQEAAFQGAFAYYYDHPEVFLWCLNAVTLKNISCSKESASMTILFPVSAYYSEEEGKQAEELLTEVAGAAPADASRYETVKYYHDWILQQVTYGSGDSSDTQENTYYAHTALGGLIRGQGVCETYAKIFAMLCDRNNIPNLYVVSSSHAWNYVKMEDGLWYMVDCTYDDSAAETDTYFLCSNEPAVDSDHSPITDYTWPSTSENSYRANHPEVDPGTDDQSPTVIRLAGETRYETAIAGAAQLYEENGSQAFSAFVIASGDAFPDALAGGPLAAQLSAPILLTGKNAAKNQEVYDFISSYGNGTPEVYLLGGEAAVPATVEESLKQMGCSVNRIWGRTRYDTDLEIIRAMAPETGCDVIIVSGSGYADALSASGVAGQKKISILLAGTGGLSDDQLELLESLSPSTVWIIGGSLAVPPAVETQLAENGLGEQVIRISGANRYETSLAVAEAFFTEDMDSAVIAYGGNFPDGLTGGVLAARLTAPVLLTDNTSTALQTGFLSEHQTKIRSLYLMGGTSVISEQTAELLTQALE